MSPRALALGKEILAVDGGWRKDSHFPLESWILVDCSCPSEWRCTYGNRQIGLHESCGERTNEA